MKHLFTIALLLFGIQIQAQRTCGTQDYLRLRMDEDPALNQRLQKQNLDLRSFSLQKSADGQRAVYRIPVVVHVVYRTATENISDAQIQSQMEVLNNDYRKLNSDATLVPSLYAGLATDCEIEFCLASRTPSGAPTTGITRTLTTVNTFPIGDQVKRASTGGEDAWDTSKYLNIWVCNLTGSILGFATLPGTVNPALDGVVIGYKYFGTNGTAQAPYNKGRTATHEVGHWFNLLHIWGDDEGVAEGCSGTDEVDDTPNQDDANYGCPTFPAISCSNQGDMSMNYMDYTDDRCMYMFTHGQRDRMQATINVLRPGLLTSLGCFAPSPDDCDTLNNITGGDGLVYYYAQEIAPQETGYLTGTNSRNDKAFAELHTTAAPRLITGARIDFAQATATTANSSATVYVWDDNGTGGKPGTALASASINLNDVVTNIANFTYTDVSFANPPLLTGNYYIGFAMGTISGDTLAVYSNQFDEINTNTAWLRDASNTWYAFDDPMTYGDALSLAMRPIQCIAVNIESLPTAETAIRVFPNPADAYVQLQGMPAGALWNLVAMDGRVVAQGQAQGLGQERIALDQCAEGLYLVSVQYENQRNSLRVLIAR